ncbi:hypothetical protein COU37_04835 [Candidatus Micrarchaeota archaeon CG10_big_fil_rev_8_21_14_0_10_45_29]|nr:MAG: hypothetical protein COU37_04835 [Candidatus Micrarchaeota archaeon CG10_big_fil_rev_8_21_14_0_10_45_29]
MHQQPNNTSNFIFSRLPFLFFLKLAFSPKIFFPIFAYFIFSSAFFCMLDYYFIIFFTISSALPV